jgi:hypothetical protein
MSQNRFGNPAANRKSCCPYEHRNGSFLSRHRPDARVALQQSPVLQSDMDKLREMSYNGKYIVQSLRPFTQLLEHTHEIFLL